MSPASQGGLEVERYIGTCLFSTQTRAGAGPAAKAAAAAVAGGGGPAAVSPALSKARTKGPGAAGVFPFGPPRYSRVGSASAPPQASPPPPWAGLPLISLAAAQHRRSGPGAASATPDDGLAQLAIRTQGAPLILAGRYHHHHHHHHHHASPMAGGRSAPHHASRPRPSGPRSAPSAPRQNSNVSGVAPTSASTAKEGKTAPGDNISVASDESSGGHSSENSLPRIIKPRKRRKKDRKPPATTATSVSTPASPSQSPPPPSPSPSPPSREEQILDSKSPTVVPPPEAEPPKPAVGAARAPGSATRSEGATPLNNEVESCSSCQCRYCDPAGRVWAALPAGAAPLRRSWSEPTPASGPPPPSPSSPSPPSPLPVASPRFTASPVPCASASEDGDEGASGALQVSTHIVTSLNGHRDLEIRFFSSSPPQRAAPMPQNAGRPCVSPWGAPASSPPPSPLQTVPPPPGDGTLLPTKEPSIALDGVQRDLSEE